MSIKYAITGSSLVQSFLYRLIRGYCWTFCLRVENEDAWLAHLRAGGTVLICSWHQQFFSAIRHFQTYQCYRPSLMISQSKDGDMIAGIARLSGWCPVRGSSSKNGAMALREMIGRLQQFHLAGHVVDGPRGPSGVVKAGVIHLAHAADAVIVPFYVSADRAWSLKSWDKFLLPKPFARVSLRFGEMIRFDPKVGAKDLESQRLYLEAKMLPGLKAPAI